VLVGEPGKPESGGAFPISFTLMEVCKAGMGATKAKRGHIEVTGEANMRSKTEPSSELVPCPESMVEGLTCRAVL
jgi:hypothetical protein